MAAGEVETKASDEQHRARILRDGRRQGGPVFQMCLTNRAMRRELVRVVRERLKANPGSHYCYRHLDWADPLPQKAPSQPCPFSRRLFLV